MRIQIDDNFLMDTDDNNFILKEVKISNGEKTKGEKVENIVGYYGKIEHLIEAYFTKQLLRSDATSFDELLVEVRSLRTYLKTLFRPREKECDCDGQHN